MLWPILPNLPIRIVNGGRRVRRSSGTRSEGTKSKDLEAAMRGGTTSTVRTFSLRRFRAEATRTRGLVDFGYLHAW